jgi:23S rRNA (adenine2503-C2)-methyltransferase
MTTERINLLGLPRVAMERLFTQMGEKPFHARQVMRWIYRRGVGDFDAMTDLSKSLRARLAEHAEVRAPAVRTESVAGDDTRKWLFDVGGQGVETVFIPEPDRRTLCISSQVGCALDCSFCATGAQGFNRNLTTAEIVGQVWHAHREMLADFAHDERPVTNIVLMGMGEPLANYRSVLPALEILLEPMGFDVSRRRLTLSTSGLVPMIRRLGQDCNVALAVSLHAPDDELRNELVPINRKHPIAELLDACWHYASEQTGRHITFEYVMLDGVNDSLSHARALVRLLRGRPAKVNLIPFNPFPGTSYRRSPQARIAAFKNVLLDSSVTATVRRTRGDDIDAACGQLAGQVSDRTTVRLGDKRFAVAVEGR